MVRATTKCLFGALIVSSVLFIVSLVLAFRIFPDMVFSEDIEEDVSLKKGTDQFESFMELPFPVEFKVYIFHIENPDGILQGDKPVVKEVGPYIYKLNRKKTKISADCDDDTFTYTEEETLEFDAEASEPLTLQDTYTVLNLPMMLMYEQTEEQNRANYLYLCANEAFPTHELLFTQATVEELVLEGYSFCELSSSVLCGVVNKAACESVTPNKNIVSETLEGPFQFSYFNYRQGTDGIYMIKRGADDVSEVGQILTWNDGNFTDYWGEDTSCNEIKGTDSTIFPPHITKDSSFSVFLTEICRTLKLDYLQESTYKDVHGYEFGPSQSTFWSSTDLPDEDCFCTKLTYDVNKEENCYLNGVLDLRTCTGMPVLLSFPHFLGADESYKEAVDGLTPNENDHRTYFLIEPNTGRLLQGVKRTQLNAVIRPIIGVDEFSNIPRVVLPLLWVEESLSLPDSQINKLEPNSITKRQVAEGVGWGLVGSTAGLLVIFGGVLVYKKLF